MFLMRRSRDGGKKSHVKNETTGIAILLIVSLQSLTLAQAGIKTGLQCFPGKSRGLTGKIRNVKYDFDLAKETFFSFPFRETIRDLRRTASSFFVKPV